MTGIRYLTVIVLLAVVAGCAAQIDPTKVRQHELAVQRMQTATFATHDLNAVKRGVIAALQDLNFVIENLDGEHGSISAKKFGTYPIKMTVTIQAKSSERIVVHAIAQYKLQTLEDPALYERFFTTMKDFLPSTQRAGQ